MHKGIIILGSSNSTGHTYQFAKILQEETGFRMVDLKSKNIGEYDYDYKNSGDDFLPLIKDIADNYDIVIFATPVYWYAMSGIMKTFFDRLSDCLHYQKETGRKLRGKQMGMITTSSSPEMIKGFEMPFVNSANYLGMDYLGHVHAFATKNKMNESDVNSLRQYAQKLRE